MELILAEELLLLVLDDGAVKRGGAPGVAGAALVDLVRAGALDAAGSKLVAVPDAPLAHPLLAACHARIAAADRPRDALSWIAQLRAGAPDGAAERLVAADVLRRAQRKRFGIIAGPRLETVDPGPEQALRERLRATVLGERAPTPHDAALVALLVPAELWRRFVPDDRRKEAKRRALEIADGGLTAQGLDAAHGRLQFEVLKATVVAVSRG